MKNIWNKKENREKIEVLDRNMLKNAFKTVQPETQDFSLN